VQGERSEGPDPKGGGARPFRQRPHWHPKLTAFQRSDDRRAAWQAVQTLGPYAVLWFFMVRSLEAGMPYAVTLLLAAVAALFFVRLFILFHDCVHGSFFSSPRANAFFGYLFGVLVFTSFDDWRTSHLRHHTSYANLDTRGFGDVWTMTLSEYEAAPRRKRLLYRAYRHPLVLIGLGAVFLFLLANRLPSGTARRTERSGVVLTNLLILALVLGASAAIGWRSYLAVQLPVLWMAGAAGIWLFYVQHQFEGVYWARKDEWDPYRAALEGSSFYRLPSLLAWFSGDIGYHHVHHLSPRIPNYRLRECYEAVPELRQKEPLTIRKSLGAVRLKLWDEEQGRMIPFPG